ncbi:MAG: hypothetical protein U0K35_08515 [Prevotella sp.]|jgi:uncharacterized protein YlxW (UPF0749 family)|nr:hypothetical protein [Prevotella sp.]
MSKKKETLSEKIIMAFSSFWAKAGITTGFIAGVFWFGRYYQESIMIRENTKQERDFNEMIFQFQKENLSLQEKCNHLQQEVKELNFKINKQNESKE